MARYRPAWTEEWAQPEKRIIGGLPARRAGPNVELRTRVVPCTSEGAEADASLAVEHFELDAWLRGVQNYSHVKVEVLALRSSELEELEGTGQSGRWFRQTEKTLIAPGWRSREALWVGGARHAPHGPSGACFVLPRSVLDQPMTFCCVYQRPGHETRWFVETDQIIRPTRRPIAKSCAVM